MYQRLDVHDFMNEFHRYGRQKSFSREGFVALFDYLEEWEVETGEPYELDVIAIDCEWAEATPQEIYNDYDCEDSLPLGADPDDLEEQDIYDAVCNTLEACTTHIELSNGNFLYMPW